LYRFFIKPFFDRFFAITSILVLFPLLVLAAICIKFDSRGPILFIQTRLGRNQKQFRLFKFRTMSHEQRIYTGQTYANDPSITTVGKILRRYKIDELPQLFNILMGDMSIVGPRPCLQKTYDLFHDNNTVTRFAVKPGLTSPAGVNGSIYLSWEQKWWYDKWYVDNISFLVDLHTILKTIIVVFLGEKHFFDSDKGKDGN